ncbi:MAG: hypothetical protein FWC12_12035 [Treponema sp.]|nr:hypothetical protein [Treponema sp.]
MKNKPQIIVMLTQNDVTVKNARDCFLSACDLDIKNWGFKNTGIGKDEMFSLVKTIKEKGKTAILEIVSYDEPTCLDIVKNAAECGIDQIMGTVYSASIHDFLDKKNIPYKPFIGKVSGNPSILEGSLQEIINDAKTLLDRGVSGFDLLAYRRSEKAEELARMFLNEIDSQKAKTSISGGICSFEQIDFLLGIGSWAFTIGTALFENKFAHAASAAPNSNFRENLSAVLEYYNKKKAPH